jgi:hypothetical protein
MDKLRQIIRAFDGYKLRHVDVLNNEDSKSQHTKLYRAVVEGKVKTDDEAARFLFGPTAHKGMQKYRNFKTDFKKRLLNTMLFIDPTHDDFDKYQQIFYEVNREWMTIKAIYANGMSFLANPLAEQLLQITLRYDYTEITVLLLNHIKFGIAMQGDKKQYAEYQQLHSHYIELWLMEQKAKEYTDILKMEYVKTNQYKPFMSDIAKRYFEELKPALEKYDAVGLHTYGRVIEIYIYSTVNDYKNVLDVAERALTFFRSKPFEVNLSLSIFQHQKMQALMMLKRFAEAEQAIEETIALRVKGSFNWFKAQESKVFLLFKMHRFTEGYALYADITKMLEFQDLPNSMSKEMWHLFNAYFHLLNQLGKAPLLALGTKNEAFKISELLNDIPILVNDKKGMNLAVLSVKMCFLVVSKQYDELDKYEEPIRKYLYRNTDRDDPNYRFYQFCLMCLESFYANFNRALTIQNAAELLENLKSQPYNPYTATLRGEAIQLEILWDWTLEALES